MSAVAGAARRRPGRLPVAHAVVGSAIAGAGLASLTVWSLPYRSLEARAAAAAVGVVTRTQVYRNEWLVTGRHGGLWLVVTSACTSSLMLLPVVAFAAWACLARRMPLLTVVAGLAAGAGVVVLANTARQAQIALAWRAWGGGSLWASHDLAGTLISLAGTFAGLVAQLLVSGWLSRARRPLR